MLLLWLILFSLVGTLLGTFTGLVPGIHVNNIALIALYLYATGADPGFLSVLIVSAMIAHTFLDFIPSTFLGAPDESTALSLLPTHRMLLSGEGYRAVYLSAIGSLLAMLLSLPIVLLFQIAFSKIPYGTFTEIIPAILISVVLYMIYMESRKGYRNMLVALYVFFLSGLFGMLVFSLPQNYNFVPVNIGSGVLFAVFAGLFGLPTLLLSTNSPIPSQKVDDIPVKREHFKASFLGTLSGAIVGFVPGVTSGIAAVIAQGLQGTDDTENFVVAMGSVNTANALFNLAALFIILHPRSRAVGIIGEISYVVPWCSLFHPPSFFILLLFSAFLSAFISFFLTLFVGKISALKISKVGEHYRKLSFFVILFILALVFIFGGFLGIVIVTIATLIGILPPKLGIMRVHLMGVLILPVLIFYLS